MDYTHLTHRHALRKTLVAVALLSSLLIPMASAEETVKSTLILRPHCETNTATCPAFEVEDPTSLRTASLKQTDTLDMDLVFANPQKKKISRVRAWLLYNPATLTGKGIALGTSLPVAAPGEKDFSDEEGFAKIDVSPTAGQEPADESIVVARIQFSVKAIPAGNTDVLAFYDVQATGHTLVTALGTNNQSQNMLTEDPSQLIVYFDSASSSASNSASSVTSSAASSVTSSAGSQQSEASTSSSAPSSAMSSNSSFATGICGNGAIEDGEQCDDGNFLKGDGCSQTCTLETSSTSAQSQASSRSLIPSQADGSICTENVECSSGLCSNGICRGTTIKVENGGACHTNDQCLSARCTEAKCVAEQAGSSAPSGTGPFGILQVRNLRVTSQGSTVFLAWDALASAQINGYNIYYGTTSGRYLQRKTVDKNTKLIDIRALPEGTTYYFAARAVSVQGEESAFSQEVAVEVGKPASSTSPLKGNLLNLKKPLKTSDTGLPSGLALLLLVSAVTGTLFASRRQLSALTHAYRSHD